MFLVFAVFLSVVAGRVYLQKDTLTGNNQVVGLLNTTSGAVNTVG